MPIMGCAWLLVSALLIPVVGTCESLASGPSSPEISGRDWRLCSQLLGAHDTTPYALQ